MLWCWTSTLFLCVDNCSARPQRKERLSGQVICSLGADPSLLEVRDMPVLRALCGEDYSPDINAPPDTGAVDIATQDIARFIALHLCGVLWAQGSCGYSSLLEELNLTPWALMSDSCSTLKQLMVSIPHPKHFDLSLCDHDG